MEAPGGRPVRGGPRGPRPRRLNHGLGRAGDAGAEAGAPPAPARRPHPAAPPPRVRLRLLPGGRTRRPLLPGRIRLAPVAAALAVGLVAGSVAVGGPWQRPEGLSVDAAEVTRGVAAAATTLSAYQAR